LINFEMLIEEGVISKEDMDIFTMVDSAYEAWEYIVTWHKKNGEPLFSELENDNLNR